MDFLQEELDEILNIFSQEGTEILQSMDKNLLLLEKKPNNQDIAMHLFRDAHSLKGSARMLGFNGIQNIAHKIEDVLGLIREGKLSVNSTVTDTISDALNLIDILIKKTVEQKSEFISEEGELHIKKLSDLCSLASIETKETKKQAPQKKEKDFFSTNFEKFEDLITGIIFIYSKSIHDNNFEQFQDIIGVIGELSHLIEKTGYQNLYNLSISMLDLAGESNRLGNINEEILYELNLKINEFIQAFQNIASSKNLKTANYYEKAYKISEEEKIENEPAENENLKDKEVFEIIDKAIETIPDVAKNRHSTAEIKSLLNEIVLKIKDDKFKKIFQEVLSIILNFEKNNSKLKTDAIDAIKEILSSSKGILEAKSSTNLFGDFTEETELLSQKTSIIAQMITYELQNPAKSVKSQKTMKPSDWAQSFDTSSIKTLRVNSDKLDKLVNQIGNLIVTRIKSHENVGLVKTIQDEMVEWQKHYHKIGYYMKFYEKKYIQEMQNSLSSSGLSKKKDSFLSYNKQLISFHNSNSEKINFILDNLNLLMKELQENNIKLNAATSEIENMVKSMRILPLSTVFNLFPRMVHNISKDNGKNIELIIEGGEVSADKKIIEVIKIPIMHIVRNSIDHGIELPKERERLLKNKTGTIIIKASQKESKIVISIKDDGRGINIEKIKRKAIEKGFVSQEAADAMSKEQLANFIFYPGFSTGDKVTELSGRGLGLDIVHTKISQLNGRIDVYSEENKGTVVTMELPTTMATMKAFIMMENNQLFAIPASSIQTVLRIGADEIKNRDNRYYFIYNNEAVPICSLSSILNMPEKEEILEKYTLMVIKSESVTTGIIVQKLIGDEEILNKKLPEPMLRVKNISGITTLANGEMCLLLNVSDLLTSNMANPKELSATKTLTLQDNSKYKILVVDDSVTTRRLLKNVLSSNNYTVEAETNAKEALRKLDTKEYHLVISDYEMPEMNGYEFVKAIRESEKTKNIPVIVLTSIERPDLKEEFYKLNIQDYIKKEYFEQQAFLRTVNKYLNFSIDNDKK